MFKNSKMLKCGLSFLLCTIITMMAGTISGCSNFFKESKSKSTDKEIVNENKDLDEFDKADINVNVGDVDIVKGSKYAIEAEYDKNREELSYDVNNKKLIVKGKRKDGEIMVNFFSFTDVKPMKIKIYVPNNAEMDELKMKLGTGDGTIKGINSSMFDINGETGSVKCSDIISQEFNAEISTGDFKADNFTADKAVIKNSCGSVDLRSLKTKGINIENNTGDIDLEGELKGENIIKCDTGSIDIKSSLDKKDYSYDVDNSVGDFELDGEKIKGDYKENNDSASNSFNIKIGTGNLNIEF